MGLQFWEVLRGLWGRLHCGSQPLVAELSSPGLQLLPSKSKAQLSDRLSDLGG